MRLNERKPLRDVSTLPVSVSDPDTIRSTGSGRVQMVNEVGEGLVTLIGVVHVELAERRAPGTHDLGHQLGFVRHASGASHQVGEMTGPFVDRK